MTEQAEVEPNRPIEESHEGEGYSEDEEWENHVESALVSIHSFLKGDQTQTPNSPRTLDCCQARGIDPEDLVLIPYEEMTAASDQERRLRFDAREKRRRGYIKEVRNEYQQQNTPNRPQSLPNLDSVRSQVATDRKKRVDSLLSREQKALARHERVLQDSLHRSVTEQLRADQIEADYSKRINRIEGHQRRQCKEREAASVNKSVWRQSKLDKAREMAALDLERHANKVLEKEQARLRALERKEMKQATEADRRRQHQQHRAKVVAAALGDAEALKNQQEEERQQYDALREQAYQESIQQHRMDAELRGRQKDIVTDHKREKVRAMEREMVEHHRQAALAKDVAFERRQAAHDEKKRLMAQKRLQWEMRARERQQQVRQEAETRKQEMEKQLILAEESSERAQAKRNRQKQIKAVRQQIRSEELEAAQKKLARMEAHKQEQLIERLELQAERDHVLQQERQKESELLQALKRRTALMQKDIKDKACKQYRKMRLTDGPETGSIEPSH